MSELKLTESEIELGAALSVNIQSLNNSLMAMAMTEQLYIQQLRQERGLGDQFRIVNWEDGFEEVTNGE